MRSVDDEEYAVDLAPGPLAKVAFVGNSGVGKSALFHALTDGTFNLARTSTLGADFRPLVMKSNNGVPVNVALWDTAGQERCRSLSRMHVRGSDVVLAVYDVNNLDSREELLSENWQSFEELHRDPEIRQCPVIVIGTKYDATVSPDCGSLLFVEIDGTTIEPTQDQLAEEGVVKRFVEENGYDSGFLTSAYTKYRFEELKALIADFALDSMDRKEQSLDYRRPKSLHAAPQRQRQAYCCPFI